jgi:flagella basal body P-ring formation protein FlgA
MRLIQTLAGIALLAGTLPAQAAGFMDPGLIDTEVAQFTGAAIGSAGGARLPVDRRLKLARCAGPLALDWYGQRRDTVLVSCPDGGGWRIYVPVETAAAGGTGRQEVAVMRGDNVSITLSGKGFTLSRQGEALEQGVVGQWIRVRPAGNARAEPIRAKVLRPGAVGTDLP